MLRHGSWAATVLGVLLICLLGGCRAVTLGLGETQVASGDGLGLKFDLAGKLVAVTLDDQELPKVWTSWLTPPGGFYVREAGSAANQEALGSAVRTDEGLLITAAPGGIRLRAIVAATEDRIEVRGRLINRDEGPRGVTLGLSLPVDAGGWVLGRSILDDETLTGAANYGQWTCADSDWDGRLINRGMFTPIFGEKVGLALGSVCDHPQVFRVSYKQGRGFTIEIDLGLSPLPRNFPNTATFKFILYRFDPAGGLGYRSALAKYYRMFPDEHALRSKRFGNALAAEDMNALKFDMAGQAVGFGVDRESADELTHVRPHPFGEFFPNGQAPRHEPPKEAKAYAVLPYCRGFYLNLPMSAGSEDRPAMSADQARRAASLYAAVAGGGFAGDRCLTWGPDGKTQLWSARGPVDLHSDSRAMFPGRAMLAIAPTNPDPDLPAAETPRRLVNSLDEVANPAGLFIDGLWDVGGRYLENHRPDQLRTVDYPLTFSYWTGRPAQFGAFMWQELLRPLAEYLHGRDLLLFADVRPWRASVMFDQGLIDVYRGAGRTIRSIQDLAYLRTLVGQRPISGAGIGQDPLDPEKKYSARELAQMERDLNVLLPYCWFPGGVGPKALWQKYCVPMQEMAAAGWEPLPGAVLAHPDLLVERYGGPDDAKVFYAVHNLGERPIVYELAIDLTVPGIDPKTVAVVERLNGQSPEATTVADSLVLRARVDGRATSLFQLSRTGGAVQPDLELKTAETPRQSTIPPLVPFDPDQSASQSLQATLADLDLRPRTAQQFLLAYQRAKHQVASAVAFHLARENPAGDPDAAAAELANWLAPRFDAIYESVLPAPALARWLAMRTRGQGANEWKLGASAVRTEDGRFEVRVWDPLLEKP